MSREQRPTSRRRQSSISSPAQCRRVADATCSTARCRLCSAAAGQKRRIHQTPSRTEVVACRPWLLAELGVVQPDVLVLLGATAAKSLMGNDFRLSAHRGEVLRPPDTVVHDKDLQMVASIHPSAVLRTPREGRDAAYGGLVSDLRLAASLLG